MTINKTLAAALLALCATIIAACGNDQASATAPGHDELFGNNASVRAVADYCMEGVRDGYLFADSGMPLPSDDVLFQDYAYEECIYAAFDILESEHNPFHKLQEHEPISDEIAMEWALKVNLLICRNRINAGYFTEECDKFIRALNELR